MTLRPVDLNRTYLGNGARIAVGGGAFTSNAANVFNTGFFILK
jgi:hypothetical protein